MMHLSRGGLGRNRVPPAAGGGGGITLGNAVSQQFTTGTSHAFSSSLVVTTGSTIVVSVLNSGGDPSAISDGTNTYTKRRSQQRASFADKYQTLWTAENVTGGTYTITITTASSTCTAIALELDGTAA